MILLIPRLGRSRFSVAYFFFQELCLGHDVYLGVVQSRTLLSRNVTVMGRRTSVRLEPAMWRALREIAWREECRTHDLCSPIARRKHPDTTLTAAIRIFLMHYYRAAATRRATAARGTGSAG
jgi:predicted DNA-binding ribbon-helix-helix protein